MTDRHQLAPTPVRIDDGLKAKEKAEAVAYDRSLTGEILARLRSTFRSNRPRQPSTTKEQQE